MDLIRSLGKKKLSFFGISFKAGTDDLRFSPVLEVIENFIGKGYDIKVFDRNVSMSRLIGGNKSFIMENYPHVGELLVENKDEVLSHGEVVIISNGDKVYQDLGLKEDQIIVDLEGTEGYYNHPKYFGTTR
jgi:GDP-mannose 6-dehydrogenase